MSIVKRGKNSWQVRIFLGRDQSGRMKFYNETIQGNRRDAEALETKKKRELDLGVFIEHSRISFDEYLDKWLEVSARPRLKERTYEDYGEYLRRYVRPALGAKRLGKLKPLEIQALYTWMLEQGLSPRTVRYTHAILSSALKQAVKWQVIGVNPASMVDLPQNHRKEMKALDPDDSTRFLKAAATDRWYVIFLVALTTGMRPEEYLGLQWKDIDFESGVIVIQRALVWRRKGGGWTLQEPKTSRSRRSVPLSGSILQELKLHRKRQLEERMKLGEAYENNNFVFATELGSPIQPSNLTRRHFKKILDTAGLSRAIRLYDLRHTCATLLLSRGISPKVIAERLGHSTVVLTLDTYSHVLPQMQKDATEELERMFFKASG